MSRAVAVYSVPGIAHVGDTDVDLHRQRTYEIGDIEATEDVVLVAAVVDEVAIQPVTRAAVHDVADAVVLPEQIPAGDYALSVGVVGLDGERPVVQLGITGRDDNGWYSLSTMKVVR